jgi:hypothetical protein
MAVAAASNTTPAVLHGIDMGKSSTRISTGGERTVSALPTVGPILALSPVHGPKVLFDPRTLPLVPSPCTSFRRPVAPNSGSAYREYRLTFIRLTDYSIFGIAVDRKHKLKWLFPQEKATFQCSQEV